MKARWIIRELPNFELVASTLIACGFVGAASILYAPRLEDISWRYDNTAYVYASYCWMNAKKLVR